MRKAEILVAVTIAILAIGWITGGAIVYQQVTKGAIGDKCTTQKIIVPIWLDEKCVPALQAYDCNETGGAELIQCDLFEGTVVKNKLGE